MDSSWCTIQPFSIIHEWLSYEPAHIFTTKTGCINFKNLLLSSNKNWFPRFAAGMQHMILMGMNFSIATAGNGSIPFLFFRSCTLLFAQLKKLCANAQLHKHSIAILCQKKCVYWNWYSRLPPGCLAMFYVMTQLKKATSKRFGNNNFLICINRAKKDYFHEALSNSSLLAMVSSNDATVYFTVPC